MPSNKEKFRLPRLFLRNYVLGTAVLTFSIAYAVFNIGKATLISARGEHAGCVANDLGFEIYDQSSEPLSKTLATLVWSDSSTRARLDKITAKYLNHFDVERINIVDSNERIVYSTNPGLIGGYLRNNQELIKALAGIPVSTLGSATDESDDGVNHKQGPVLQSVIPFRIPGDDDNGEKKVIGAFQIYRNATVLSRRILTVRNTVFAASLTIFVLFILHFRFALRKAEHMQMKLSEEKSKLQVILNHVPSAFVLVDTDLRIQSTSAALREFSGKSLADVKNQHCYDIICNKKTPVGSCPTRKALKTNRVENTILTFKQNGTNRYLEHVAVPIRNNGKIESILEIITDITEKKKMQDCIIQAEKLSAVGQVAATIAHEIRNGLTSVKLILQHLAASLTADKTKNKAASVALESINDMENIVRQLLDFARPTPVSFKMADINKLLRHSVDFCRQQIKLKCLKLQEDYVENLPMLRLDAEHMRIAMVNLILNAVQASKDQDMLRIQITSALLEENLNDYFIEKKTELHLTKNRPVVKIAISDTGCGIPAENLSRIFDPFFTTKIDGSGLGLPVTRRTVHEHGGIMRVESQPNQGSTFTIILPIEPPI
ncbi:MAG: nitrogen regulation protein NR(II) [bacterium]